MRKCGSRLLALLMVLCMVIGTMPIVFADGETSAAVEDCHFTLQTSDGNVFQWDATGETKLSYANGILTTTMTKSGNSVYFKGIPEGKTLDFNKYRYVVFKMDTIATNETFSVYVAGSEGIKNESQHLNNMKRFDKDGYTYCIFDLSAKKVSEMQSAGLWQDGIKTLRLTTKQGGTYKISDVYVSSQSPAQEFKSFSIKADSSTITSNEGQLTLKPYVELTNDGKVEDYSSVAWAVDSVNASAEKNSDGSLTLTGKLNGKVKATAYFTYDNIERVAEYTVTISGQPDRVASKSIKLMTYGNSIHKHAPNPSLGWEHNWGMAASSEDKDYVHQLIRMLGEKYGKDNIEWVIGTGHGNFEPDLSNGVEGQDWTEYLKGVKECAERENPDIITVQFGENTQTGNANYTGTENGYRDGMIQFVRMLKEGAPDALVLITTPFWGGSPKINGAKKAAKTLNIPLAELAPLTTDENEALDGPSTWSQGVKIHPGDKGMLAIAEEMYKQLNKFLTGSDNVAYFTTPPTSISIDKSVTTITEDSGELALSTTALPEGAPADAIWTSSKPEVATVDANGKVKAISNGETVITAKSKYTANVSDSITISVSNQSPIYTVSFNANTTDKASDMPSEVKMKAGTISLVGKYPLRDEYNFVGWSTSADGDVADTASISGDTTLYAIWTKATEWNFERSGYLEGFKVLNGFNVLVDNGVLRAYETDYSETNILKFVSPKIDINASDYGTLKIRMKNTGFVKDTVAKVVVHTTDGDKSFEYPVNSVDYVDYAVPLKGVNGKITGFEIIPTNIDCGVYIDSITFEESTTPVLVSSTLPDNGENALLGYNRYEFKFSKAVNSVVSVSLGDKAVSDYSLSADGKTVEVGLRLVDAGENTLTLSVKGADGETVTVSRRFSVPDTLLIYADFNSTMSGLIPWHYFGQGSGKLSFVTDSYHSPSKAIKMDSENHTDDDTYVYLNVDQYSVATIKKKFEKDKTYKMSFWAKREDPAKTPKLDALHGNDVIKWNIMITSDTMAKYEVVFTSKSASQNIGFYGGAKDGNIIIDDVLIEEISKPNLVSTTLPEETAVAPLGYNRYSMTFDKKIASVSSLKLDSASVSDYKISADGKTVEFGLKTIKNGTNTVTAVVKDIDGCELTVTKNITVPDTLVAYTGFDKGETAGYYITNNGWSTPLVEDAYHSPGASGKMLITEEYGAGIDVVTETGYTKVDFGNAKPTAGKWYKVSFWAKPAVKGEKPHLGVARREAGGQGVGVKMFQIDSDEFTKYEVTYRAVSDKMPFLYREQMIYEILIDDILIEEVSAPAKYTFTLNTSTVTAGASVKAKLSNVDYGDGMSGAVVVALYKDGRLVDVKTASSANLEVEKSLETTALTVPEDISDGVYTVSAFLWDSLSGAMKPLQAPINIGE